MFSGTIGLKICEGCGLRPTELQKSGISFQDDQPIDPYVSIDVDENHLDQSSTKLKTFDPVWNENFILEVQNAVSLGLTVFHDNTVPPHDFVGKRRIPFQDLLQKSKDLCDFWVNA